MVKKMSGIASELDHTTTRSLHREDALTAEAANRISSLEDQLDRHRRALAELAKASEQMTQDNALLGGEVARMRDEKEERERAMAELTERLQGLQELYLRGVESSIPSTVTVKEATEQKFWRDIVKTDLLSVTQPPEDFPMPVVAPPQDAIIMLQENGSLRRQLDTLTHRNHVLEGDLDHHKKQLHALQKQVTNERRVAKDLAAKLQSQLLGAVRRLWFSNEETKKAQLQVKEKDRYIRKLEDQLLSQHKAMHALKRRVQEREVEDAAARTDAVMGLRRPGPGTGGAGAYDPPAPSRALPASPAMQRAEHVVRHAQEASERLAGSLMRILHPELGGSGDPDRPLTEALMARLEGLAATSGEVVEAMAQVKAALELSQAPSQGEPTEPEAAEPYYGSGFNESSSLFTYALERQEMSDLKKQQGAASQPQPQPQAPTAVVRPLAVPAASESMGSMSLAVSSQTSAPPEQWRGPRMMVPTPSGMTGPGTRDLSAADLVVDEEEEEGEVRQPAAASPRAFMLPSERDDGSYDPIDGSGISFPYEAAGPSDHQAFSSPGFFPTPAGARGRQPDLEATPERSEAFPRALNDFLVLETPSYMGADDHPEAAPRARPAELLERDPSLGTAQVSPIGGADSAEETASSSSGLEAMREHLREHLGAPAQQDRESPAAAVQRMAEERLDNLEDLQQRLASIMARMGASGSTSASASVSSSKADSAMTTGLDMPSPVPILSATSEDFVGISLAEIEGLARELQVQRDTTNSLLGGGAGGMEEPRDDQSEAGSTV